VILRGPENHPEFQLALKNRDALAELFIVSQVNLVAGEDEANLAIEVAHAAGGRCPRCWRWLEDLSGGGENTEVCPRCVEARRIS